MSVPLTGLGVMPKCKEKKHPVFQIARVREYNTLETLCSKQYYMALSYKDCELPNSEIRLA